jgi:hypothetical protein
LKIVVLYLDSAPTRTWQSAGWQGSKRWVHVRPLPWPTFAMQALPDEPQVVGSGRLCPGGASCKLMKFPVNS